MLGSLLCLLHVSGHSICNENTAADSVSLDKLIYQNQCKHERGKRKWDES